MHQAVLSALLVEVMASEKLLLLPPEYSYPYNLHLKVPAERRAGALNDVVCAAVEDRVLDPDLITDIRVDEPLRSWLQKYC